MLTEQYIASTGVPTTKAVNTNAVLRDAGIFLHEFRPLAAQRIVCKKSATAPHCLAVSEHHIFAAQAEKAVVHVYGREKGTQQATIPFPERITSICLACDNTVLVLGTVEGRLFLWEIFSGRQISTRHAHLQAVTVLALDPTSTFVLSGSQDSALHVWALSDLLSFTHTADPDPIRTLSAHRASIAALKLGHSSSDANFAVSASIDKTCIIWDYRSGHVLRTYLLPGVPTALTLDPADRAIYVGYDDGSVQQLIMYAAPNGSTSAVQNGANAASLLQASGTTRWKTPDATHGPALSLDLSFDGTILMSGHASGSILTWDVARANFSALQTTVPLPGPITNLAFLPVLWFQDAKTQKNISAMDVVKPQFGAFASNDNGSVPVDYAINVRLARRMRDLERETGFEAAMNASSFPISLLDEGLSELKAAKNRGPTSEAVDEDDFVSLTATVQPDAGAALKEENTSLKMQLAALRRVQQASFDRIESLSKERYTLLARDEKRHSVRSSKAHSGTGSTDGDVDMGATSD